MVNIHISSCNCLIKSFTLLIVITVNDYNNNIIIIIYYNYCFLLLLYFIIIIKCIFFISIFLIIIFIFVVIIFCYIIFSTEDSHSTLDIVTIIKSFIEKPYIWGPGCDFNPFLGDKSYYRPYFTLFDVKLLHLS